MRSVDRLSPAYHAYIQRLGKTHAVESHEDGRRRQLTRLFVEEVDASSPVSSWRRWNLETSCSSKRATSPTGSRACRDSAVILRAVSAMGSERLSKGSYSPRSRDKGLRFTPFWTIQYS